MVSMTQALQSGASLSVHPGQIVWNTPDRSTLGFTSRHRGELHNIGVLADIDLVQGIAMDNHIELLFVMTEDLFDATKDNMPVATGRRADPAAAYHGYVVWQRRGVPNTRASRYPLTRSCHQTRPPRVWNSSKQYCTQEISNKPESAGEEEISLLRFRGGRNGHCLIHRRIS